MFYVDYMRLLTLAKCNIFYNSQFNKDNVVEITKVSTSSDKKVIYEQTIIK